MIAFLPASQFRSIPDSIKDYDPCRKKVMFSLNEGNRFVVCLVMLICERSWIDLCGLIRYLSLNPINGDVLCFYA